MLRSLLALLMILLAAPACAGSRFGGGFHGGSFHGGGFHAFHHHHGRGRVFFGGYLCGYNCGLGFYSAGYGNGYGNDNGYGNGYGNDNDNGNDNGYGNGNGNGYRYGNGAGNAVSISNGLTGGYVPDPVGADIPPLIIPTNCWVRRAAHDPSGAYFGQVLVNLCRPSDRGTVTARAADALPRIRSGQPTTGVPPRKPYTD